MDKFLLLLLKYNIFINIDIEFGKFIFNIINNPIIIIIGSYLSYNYRLGNICLPIKNIFYLKFIELYKQFFYNKIILKQYIKLKKKLKINTLLLFNKQINYIKKKCKNNKLCPIVFYKDKIYFYKFWYYENKIINYIIKKTKDNNNLLNINKKINFKEAITYIKNLNLDKYQKISLVTTLINNITFIFGKPGTGKTSLIFNITKIFLNFYKITPKIQILSTTGKSTIRIKEIFLNIDKNILKLINKITTIHKFLGINIYTNYNEYININNNKYIDILIIDESLLINLNLMFNLFYKCNFNKNIKIILLGDPNQLTSIEVGGILNSLYNYFINKKYSIKKIFLLEYFLNKKIFKKEYKKKANISNYPNLVDNITYLKKNYRFKNKSGIKKLINAIYVNDFYLIKKILLTNNYKDLKIFPLNNYLNYRFFLNYYTSIYKYILLNFSKNYNYLFNYYKKHQLICLINNGPFGINGLNYNIELYFKHNKIIPNNKFWYQGKPIMITHNNEILNLYNGNIGLTIKDCNSKYKVIFEDPNKKNNFKFVSINNLVNIITSWAITIHKSQGLEFDNVILILPNYLHPLLNKELIYTAITRAKKSITIFTNINIFIKSLKIKTLKINSFNDKIKNIY